MSARLRQMVEKLECLPTLEQGHTDNLKFDDGKHRVWLSRMTPEDYGARKAYENEVVTVEKRKGGAWVPALKGSWAVDLASKLVKDEGEPEHSQLGEQTKKAKVEVLPHSQTGRGAFTKVTLSNGFSEMFAGRLGKREAVSNTLREWNKQMLARSHVSTRFATTGEPVARPVDRPNLPPGTSKG